MKAQGLLLKQLWEDGYARDKARVMLSTVHEFDPLNNLCQSRSYYYTYFTDEETRIQKGEGPDQRVGGEPVL